MRQLWRDIGAHRRSALAFGAFWLVLLAVTALTWKRGMPGPVFSTHLLVLPLLAGFASSGFHLNSGIIGALVSLVDLVIVTVVPMAWSGLAGAPPMPQEPAFTGFAATLEFFGFVILMGVPGFLLGMLGGALGRRFSTKRTA